MKIFLMSVAFLSVSVKAAAPIDSFAVVRVLGGSPMPGSFWCNASGDFTTLKDAFNLAKWDALQYGLEAPEGANGRCSLCSAFSYNAGVYLKRRSCEERFKTLLRNFITCCSREDNNEGLAIQIIAVQLRNLMSVSAIQDFNLYNKWLQYNKNPEAVEKIASYLDGYYQTKSEQYIKDLFDYLYENVKRDQVILAQLF